MASVRSRRISDRGEPYFPVDFEDWAFETPSPQHQRLLEAAGLPTSTPTAELRSKRIPSWENYHVDCVATRWPQRPEPPWSWLQIPRVDSDQPWFLGLLRLRLFYSSIRVGLCRRWAEQRWSGLTELTAPVDLLRGQEIGWAKLLAGLDLLDGVVATSAGRRSNTDPVRQAVVRMRVDEARRIQAAHPEWSAERIGKSMDPPVCSMTTLNGYFDQLDQRRLSGRYGRRA